MLGFFSLINQIVIKSSAGTRTEVLNPREFFLYLGSLPYSRSPLYVVFHLFPDSRSCVSRVFPISKQDVFCIKVSFCIQVFLCIQVSLCIQVFFCIQVFSLYPSSSLYPSFPLYSVYPMSPGFSLYPGFLCIQVQSRIGLNTKSQRNFNVKGSASQIKTGVKDGKT